MMDRKSLLERVAETQSFAQLQQGLERVRAAARESTTALASHGVANA